MTEKPTRRLVIQCLLGLTVASAPSLSFAMPRSEGAPWWLFAPAQQGSALAGGWRIESLAPVERGAVVLTLRRGDESVEVHICARDGDPIGVAHTDAFDFVVMDGRNADGPTDVDLARSLSDLARRAGTNAEEALEGLQSHDQRVARYLAENL